MPEAPEEVVRLAEQRAQARAAKDFGEADAIRDRIASAGWTVVDEPDGTFRLERVAAGQEQPLDAQDVASVLDEPATMDVSVHWVCEGWPEDVDRAIRAFRNHAGEPMACQVARHSPATAAQQASVMHSPRTRCSWAPSSMATWTCSP